MYEGPSPPESETDESAPSPEARVQQPPSPLNLAGGAVVQQVDKLLTNRYEAWDYRFPQEGGRVQGWESKC